MKLEGYRSGVPGLVRCEEVTAASHCNHKVSKRKRLTFQCVQIELDSQRNVSFTVLSWGGDPESLPLWYTPPGGI